MNGHPKSSYHVNHDCTAGSPTRREPYGDGDSIVVGGVTSTQGGWESQPQGEGSQGLGLLKKQVCGMQTAEHILQAMCKMGEKRIPLERVYRSLFSEDLFLAAYGKISRNQGALTAGSDEQDTVDGMSLERIRRVIEDFRNERFRFTPARRI